MFIGEYRHTIDEKGRIALPAKFKNALKDGAVVTRGLDNCLFLYPKLEWVNLASRLASLPISQADNRAFARLMLAGAMDVFLDKQGRIVLPDYLRQYAGLGREVVLTGLYNRLEIWSREVWEQYSKNTEKTGADIAERLGQLGV